jgi:hypothetical protein
LQILSTSNRVNGSRARSDIHDNWDLKTEEIIVDKP